MDTALMGSSAPDALTWQQKLLPADHRGVLPLLLNAVAAGHVSTFYLLYGSIAAKVDSHYICWPMRVRCE